MSKILYIKIEQCIQVKEQSVKIGDVATMECTDQTVVNRLKTEKLLKIDDNRKKRTVVSTMLVIQKIILNLIGMIFIKKIKIIG